MKKIAILGTVGIPASYGGFETLVENLVNYAAEQSLDVELTVFCSGEAKDALKNFNGTALEYVNLDANGVSSIAYDVVSLSRAMQRFDEILLLGVSGALFLPFVRLFSNVRIVTNVDGVEWKREKWGKLASLFLRLSEWSAVKFSHEVISDNKGIADHVFTTYGEKSHVIAYGGDHAIVETDCAEINSKSFVNLPPDYCLALCRIEPENNVEMILEGFSETTGRNLVFIGNWEKSAFGRSMKTKYDEFPNIYLLDPIYDLNILMNVRSGCSFYVHGHSAGGTNPSLVEMMHFGKPILAYDCVYNRASTEEQAIFFCSPSQLVKLLDLDIPSASAVGDAMKKIAMEQYTWDKIGSKYFDLLL